MSKVIFDHRSSYEVSLLDDYISTSSGECNSLDEAINELYNLFIKRCKDKSLDMQESMKCIADDIDNGEFEIDFLGIDFLEYNKLKREIAKKIRRIIDEYLNSLSD